jgi:REP element-mobilizing transposase RayT
MWRYQGSQMPPTRHPLSGGTGFQPVSNTPQFTRRNLPHWQIGGATYFVTFRTRGVVLPREARQDVLATCRHFDGQRFTLWAAVVMPDHVHLLLRPEQRALHSWWPLASILHSIKSFAAKEINRRLLRRGSVWLDESFDRIVRDEVEFIEKWKYIRENPVKKGLCDVPEDWEALHEYIEPSAILEREQSVADHRPEACATEDSKRRCR